MHKIIPQREHEGLRFATEQAGIPPTIFTNTPASSDAVLPWFGAVSWLCMGSNSKNVTREPWEEPYNNATFHPNNHASPSDDAKPPCNPHMPTPEC
jgi:hypothetical protein